MIYRCNPKKFTIIEQIDKHFSDLPTNTFQPSAITMSHFDQFAADTGYLDQEVTAAVAASRSSTVRINSPHLNQPQTFVPAPFIPRVAEGRAADPVRYPAYHLGYRPGEEWVSLPAALADPPATPDQVYHSSAHTYKDCFVGHDLHPILFQLEPHRDDFGRIKVPELHNEETEQQVVNSRGEKLRYFSFLPRYISWEVSGPLLEFWFRLDYRLEMNDILARVADDTSKWDPQDRRKARNTLQMRRHRFRKAHGMHSWLSSRSHPEKNDLELVGQLTPLQICFNTSMIVDIQNQVLLKPIFDDDECTQPIGYIDSNLALDYFLGNLASTVPTRRMVATLALRHRLQELALVRGLGSDATAWQRLENDYEPGWWNDKKSDHHADGERAIDELDGLTHREWMNAQFSERSTDVGIAKRAATRRRGN